MQMKVYPVAETPYTSNFESSICEISIFRITEIFIIINEKMDQRIVNVMDMYLLKIIVNISVLVAKCVKMIKAK